MKASRFLEVHEVSSVVLGLRWRRQNRGDFSGLGSEFVRKGLREGDLGLSWVDFWVSWVVKEAARGVR